MLILFNGRDVNLRSHWIYDNERFGVDGIAYNFVLDPNFHAEDVFEGFHSIVEEIYSHMRSNFHPNDYVQIFVSSDGFKDSGFSLPLHQVKDLDERVLFERFGLVIQSNEDVFG